LPAWLHPGRETCIQGQADIRCRTAQSLLLTRTDEDWMPVKPLPRTGLNPESVSWTFTDDPIATSES